MKLSEKLTSIKTKLGTLHQDIADALTIQGVYKEVDDFTLMETGTLIAQIKVYDFNFQVDFKTLDSVGRIHALDKGQACGGLTINPVPYDHFLAPVLDFTDTANIKGAQVTGAFGYSCGGLTTNGSLTITIPTSMDFKGISVQPETFIPVPEETEE